MKKKIKVKLVRFVCDVVGNIRSDSYHSYFYFAFNSWWPSDTIWRHKSGSTLAQVMAYCLTTPRHYLNQCWLIISQVQWHSSGCNFTRDTSITSHCNKLENYFSKILFKSPGGKWVHLDPTRNLHTLFSILSFPDTYCYTMHTPFSWWLRFF